MIGGLVEAEGVAEILNSRVFAKTSSVIPSRPRKRGTLYDKGGRTRTKRRASYD